MMDKHEGWGGTGANCKSNSQKGQAAALLELIKVKMRKKQDSKAIQRTEPFFQFDGAWDGA